MLTTNLLLRQEKKAVWLEETRRLVVFFAGLSVVGLIVASSLLLPSYFPFVIQRQGLEESLLLEEQAAEHFQVKKTLMAVREVWAEINILKTQAGAPSKASGALEQFLTPAGGGISIAFLGIKNDGEMVLNGTAATRRDLLQFEKALRDSNKFEDITSPLSNIIRETGINFSIRGKLKSMYRL